MTAELGAGFRRALDFSGRASRAEFWGFHVLVLAAIGLLAGFAIGEVGGGLPVTLLGLVGALVVVPSLSLSIRRLHDLDMSGWWALAMVLPTIGPVFFLVIGCLPGRSGAAARDRYTSLQAA